MNWHLRNAHLGGMSSRPAWHRLHSVAAQWLEQLQRHRWRQELLLIAPEQGRQAGAAIPPTADSYHL